ncbi:hypothetical protein ACFQQB_07045 [Nonomuraea rubra]|uniref:hypothetical protein n=1 Tax=Nonomuraea rubra TaxID=46180 RepID=UPI00361FCE72
MDELHAPRQLLARSPSGPGIAATTLRNALRACRPNGWSPAWLSATAMATASAGVKLSGGSDIFLSMA